MQQHAADGKILNGILNLERLPRIRDEETRGCVKFKRMIKGHDSGIISLGTGLLMEMTTGRLSSTRGMDGLANLVYTNLYLAPRLAMPANRSQSRMSGGA